LPPLLCLCVCNCPAVSNKNQGRGEAKVQPQWNETEKQHRQTVVTTGEQGGLLGSKDSWNRKAFNLNLQKLFKHFDKSNDRILHQHHDACRFLSWRRWSKLKLQKMHARHCMSLQKKFISKLLFICFFPFLVRRRILKKIVLRPNITNDAFGHIYSITFGVISHIPLFRMD
jgi:hypothetical protein